ncbi:MAG: hypothetical protein JKY37_05335 [Nannocystaceae bacterium]|nr:hypothetical protein [Nannocystaceae bacterium]
MAASTGAINRGLVGLIKSAGVPVSRTPRRLREVPVVLAKERRIELEALLHLRDGFRALSGALLIRPSTSVAAVRGIEDWNQLTLWRGPYKHATEILFFAEDVTGRQFGLYKDSVVSFDPQDGAVERLCFSLDAWASWALEHSEALGASLVRNYNAEHETSLAAHERLQPRTPVRSVDGGDFRVCSDLGLMLRWQRLYTERAKADEPEAEGVPDWWWEEA